MKDYYANLIKNMIEDGKQAQIGIILFLLTQFSRCFYEDIFFSIEREDSFSFSSFLKLVLYSDLFFLSLFIVVVCCGT